MVEKNPYNPITEPASHKWWEEKPAKLDQKSNKPTLSTEARLSELQEKYNKLEDAFLNMMYENVPDNKRSKYLKEAGLKEQ